MEELRTDFVQVITQRMALASGQSGRGRIQSTVWAVGEAF